ncbi:MAG: hypothetical protein QOE75_2838 [Solirubrobacterales bacterium]|nr:hypothetical protein [Solirubrobacterales bacterium]
MDLVRPTSGSKRVAATVLLAVAALLAVLALSAAAAPQASAATCPSFKVLHDDRIGAAVLPAGSYTITTSATISCTQGSAFFARFLQDWDGVLPAPWRVVAQGSGKATFNRGGAFGFSVARQGSEEEENGPSPSGRLCARPFTVNIEKTIGPLFFAEGQYLIYQPARTGITCRRASLLFTRFLGQPGTQLPSPWRMRSQTATFFRPQNPVRSAFRVEPADGTS